MRDHTSFLQFMLKSIKSSGKQNGSMILNFTFIKHIKKKKSRIHTHSYFPKIK